MKGKGGMPKGKFPKGKAGSFLVSMMGYLASQGMGSLITVLQRVAPETPWNEALHRTPESYREPSYFRMRKQELLGRQKLPPPSAAEMSWTPPLGSSSPWAATVGSNQRRKTPGPCGL